MYIYIYESIWHEKHDIYKKFWGFYDMLWEDSPNINLRQYIHLNCCDLFMYEILMTQGLYIKLVSLFHIYSQLFQV